MLPGVMMASYLMSVGRRSIWGELYGCGHRPEFKSAPRWNRAAREQQMGENLWNGSHVVAAKIMFSCSGAYFSLFPQGLDSSRLHTLKTHANVHSLVNVAFSLKLWEQTNAIKLEIFFENKWVLNSVVKAEDNSWVTIKTIAQISKLYKLYLAKA